jgi:hypothetical protein
MKAAASIVMAAMLSPLVTALATTAASAGHHHNQHMLRDHMLRAHGPNWSRHRMVDAPRYPAPPVLRSAPTTFPQTDADDASLRAMMGPSADVEHVTANGGGL